MYKSPDEADQCDVKIGVVIKDAEHERSAETTALVLAHSAKAAAAGDPMRGSTPVGTFDSHAGFQPSSKGDLRVNAAKLVHLTGVASEIHVLSRSFDVHLPFPEWAFFHGEKVKQWWEFSNKDELKPMYNEILGAYRQLWSHLEKRDVNGFLDACEERSREVDIAYYKRPGDTRNRLRKELEAAMNDPKLELADLDLPPGKVWKYTVGSTGRLIALTQGSRGSPIFRYQRRDDTPFSLIIPSSFARKAAGTS
jgi:hypothetical protein